MTWRLLLIALLVALVLALLVAVLGDGPLAAEAQPAGNVPTVGYLLAGPPQCKLAPRDEGFYQSLRDLGYIPGQNITVDLRCFSTGDEMRMSGPGARTSASR